MRKRKKDKSGIESKIKNKLIMKSKRKKGLDAIKTPEKFVRQYLYQQKSYSHYRLKVLLLPPRIATISRWRSIRKKASMAPVSSSSSSGFEEPLISPSSKEFCYPSSTSKKSTLPSSSKELPKTSEPWKKLKIISPGVNHPRNWSHNWFIRSCMEK